MLELRGKIASLGVGGGLMLGAGIFGLYALGFLLATAAAGLATALDTWVALLIVGIALVLTTAALGVIGISVLKRGVPPIPERAVAEAKLTAETLKGNGRG